MGTRVFVGNLNPQTPKAELERTLSRAGEVISVYLPLDRDTRQPRGFAFVDYSDDEAAERAIAELDGALLGGRRLRLRWAFEKRPGAGADRPPERPAPEPSQAAGPDDWDWSDAAPEPHADRRSSRAWGRRRGGKHGSDRKHGRGTRRFIE